MTAHEIGSAGRLQNLTDQSSRDTLTLDSSLFSETLVCIRSIRDLSKEW